MGRVDKKAEEIQVMKAKEVDFNSNRSQTRGKEDGIVFFKVSAISIITRVTYE